MKWKGEKQGFWDDYAFLLSNMGIHLGKCLWNEMSDFSDIKRILIPLGKLVNVFREKSKGELVMESASPELHQKYLPCTYDGSKS